MEKTLLELSAEYAAVKEAMDSDQFPGSGHYPRSLDQIAAEYGAALKAFLTA